MKVLFVGPVGSIGGAERVMLTAITALKRLGHEVHLITFTDGPLVHAALKAGAASAETLTMPASLAATGERTGKLALLWRAIAAGPALWNYLRNLRMRLAKIRPDVIHSNGLKTHLILGMAKPAAPVVWHLHDFISRRGLSARLLKRYAKRPARAVAISQAVAHDARGVMGARGIDVVMNAVDVARFSPRDDANGDASPFPRDRKRDASPFSVGLVATYARWKGHDLFLRAAKRVLDADVKARFFVVGGPIYHTAGSQWSREGLEQIARRLGILEHVTFVPFVSDTASVYRSLDLVVHASTQPEPFGLTIVEAMACGRAVIVAKAGGAAEIFTHREDAIGFTPGSEVELARAIIELAGNASLREELGRAARATAVERFSDDRIGRELEACYQRAIEHNQLKMRGE